jgi:SAM-dependent methyltransferase
VILPPTSSKASTVPPDKERFDSLSVAADYNRVAEEYARHIYGELAAKPFDRDVLDRFAERTAGDAVCDAGCGPGHVARYLHDRGCGVFGIDVASRMVALAGELNPMVSFRVADLREPHIPPESLAGIVCFYSLIHFTAGELAPVLETLGRALRRGGSLLLAVHEGAESRAPGEMWGIPVALQFHFFTRNEIERALSAAGLTIEEIVHHPPYPEVEVETDRLYAWAIKDG